MPEASASPREQPVEGLFREHRARERAPTSWRPAGPRDIARAASRGLGPVWSLLLSRESRSRGTQCERRSRHRSRTSSESQRSRSHSITSAFRAKQQSRAYSRSRASTPHAPGTNPLFRRRRHPFVKLFTWIAVILSWLTTTSLSVWSLQDSVTRPGESKVWTT